MDAKIDYISFTLPLNLSGVSHSSDAHDAIFQQCLLWKLDPLLDCLEIEPPHQKGGRKIYGANLFFPTSAINVWWGGVANHTLFEISGTGCQLLREGGGMKKFLRAIQTRATRIDIAVDLPDAGKPDDFVSKKKENRFKVTETRDTDTGWTQYVGSRASERFARVYLYREPHPRSGVMRVEHVFRGDFAKETAKTLCDRGLNEVVAMCGNTYGWEHPRWEPDIVTDGKIRAQRHDKEDAATLRWLFKAVQPALVKMHKSGLVNIKEWFENYVLNALEEE